MAEQRSSSPEHAAPASALARFAPLAALGHVLSRIRRQPLHAALFVASGIMALVGIGVGAWVVVYLRGPDPTRPPLAAALAALDAEHHAEAREIAEELLAGDEADSEIRGGALFVLGAVESHEASKAFGTERQRRERLAAVQHLQEARDCGFPEPCRSEGLYLLAAGEFRVGQFADAIPLLHEALHANPERKTELAAMLAEANLRLAVPNLDEALKFNQIFLADRKLTPAERHEAILEQAQIHFLASRFEECGGTLEQIPSDSKVELDAAVLRARLRIHEGDVAQAARETDAAEQAQSRYGEAEQMLRAAEARADSRTAAARKAQLTLGLCLAKRGDAKGAEAIFVRLRKLHRGSSEALIAQLEEADLLRHAGRHETALERYLDLVPEIGGEREAQDSWLTLAELRSRLAGAVVGFRERQEFASAAALAESLASVLTPARATELLAETLEAWGRSLAQKSAGSPAADSETLASESRAQHRTAGVAFARLAELRQAEREYPYDVWRSAENFSVGHDYRHALRMLKTYLAEESRLRRAEALLAMGECYFALHKLDLALPPLLECLENHRKEPSSYRARIVASQTYLEQDKLDEAKNLLIDNLENESLAPSSLEWRDSLFALGNVLYREATDLEAQSRKKGVDSPYPDVVKVGLKELERSYHAFQDAGSRLSEAVERYPDAPQALEARYLAAETHRQAAKWPRKLRATLAIETTRAALQREAREELAAALAEYEPLLSLLIERQEKSGLSPAESLLLRNCYFAKADVLFDLERFDEAIAAYSSATNRFHDRPEALEAFVQIASCYRRMNRPVEARGTLEQAKVVLRRIPADAAFTETTRYDRGEWTELLNWLSSL